MRTRGSRPKRLLIGLAMMIVAGAILAPFAPPGPSRPAAAAEGEATTTLPPSVTVRATPTAGVTDGQRVVVTVNATTDYPIGAVEIRLCRSGVEYKSKAGRRPDPDFGLGGDNCPDIPITSFGDLSVVDTNVHAQSQSAAGNVMAFRVGAGTIKWPLGEPTHELTCDVDKPCSLVVEVRGADGVWHPWVTPITYRNSDPVTGCGGPTDGVLSTGGSDRLFDAWVGWTLAECHQDGRKGAAGRAAFQSEGLALTSFDEGKSDLAYSGAGYDPEVALVKHVDEGGNEVEGDVPERPSVAVPLALNAVVLAVGGGELDAQGLKVPYQDVKLTLDEVAKLMSGGYEGLRDDLDEIEQRNPTLRDFFDRTSGFTDQAGGFPGAESTSWFLTNHLASLRPDAFAVPNNSARFKDDAGKSRGASNDLALARPAYTNAVSLVQGRPAATKVMNIASGPDAAGGVWLFTDLVTANALGLTIVQIENANGSFVTPTPESMAAAIPTMTVDERGVRMPNPEATASGADIDPVGAGAGADAVEPYPLTFVEYGIAPAEPLADPTNVCRTTSQTVLAGWLTYLTGDGQETLPSGMQPLTPALATEATERVAQVGAKAAATPCTAAPAPVVPPVDPPTNTGAPFSNSASYNDSSAAGSGNAASRAAAASAADAAVADLALDAANTELAAASTDHPPFLGSQAASVLLAVLAMFGLAGVTYVAVNLTSGGRPSRRPQPDGS